jgi:hypothetical protein
MNKVSRWRMGGAPGGAAGLRHSGKVQLALEKRQDLISIITNCDQ